MSQEKTLIPGYQKIGNTALKGEQCVNNHDFNPSSAGPKENLYVTISQLDPTLCIVPGSMCLRLTFENTKSRFLNNLSRLLADQLKIQMGRQVVYQNIQESTLNLYKDLWLLDSTRNTIFSKGC